MNSPIAPRVLSLLIALGAGLGALNSPASAAENTFYLTERVSTVTDSGMRAFGPGTEVRKLSGADKAVKVKTIDGTELTVSSTQLTSDAAEGRRLESADRDARRQAENAAMARRLAEPTPEPAKPTLKYNPPAQGAVTAGTTSGGTFEPMGSSLDKAAEDTGTKVKPTRFPKPPRRFNNNNRNR